MSHALRRLRQLLDDELLVRAGRSMVLTERAAELAAPVRTFVESASEVFADSHNFQPQHLETTFRVVCSDCISTIILPALECVLGEQAPGVRLELLPPDPRALGALQSGEVDFAIGSMKPTDALRAQPLFRDFMVTVVAPQHPRLRGTNMSLDDFLTENHLLVAPRGDPVGVIDTLLAARGLERRVAQTVPSFLSALWQVAHSDLVLTTSWRLIRATSDRLPLRLFTTPVSMAPFTQHLVWSPRANRALETAWMRHVVAEVAKELEPLPAEDAVIARG